MAKRNEKGGAAPLSAEQRKLLAKGLVPIRKDESPIYRGNERRPLMSVGTPATGRFTARGVRLVGDSAVKRNLESRYPKAFRPHKSDLPGFMLLEPLQKYDEHAPDQYEVKWNDGNRRASVNLLPAFQPRNLEVSAGFIMEVPLSLEELPERGTFLVLHIGAATMRPEAAQGGGDVVQAEVAAAEDEEDSE